MDGDTLLDQSHTLQVILRMLRAMLVSRNPIEPRHIRTEVSGGTKESNLINPLSRIPAIALRMIALPYIKELRHERKSFLVVFQVAFSRFLKILNTFVGPHSNFSGGRTL